jgi:hypothetical protein
MTAGPSYFKARHLAEPYKFRFIAERLVKTFSRITVLKMPMGFV